MKKFRILVDMDDVFNIMINKYKDKVISGEL